MSTKVKLMEEAVKDGRSLVDLLPYCDYWKGVFIQTDGSLGKLWEIDLMDVEVKDGSLIIFAISEGNMTSDTFPTSTLTSTTSFS
ncbi:MAG: hypothetical protein HQL30_12635 [Candidatus Omnitrophica bacterium]|nr:hypothetical protein [Candidatus Omnitrophota bacterium]